MVALGALSKASGSSKLWGALGNASRYNNHLVYRQFLINSKPLIKDKFWWYFCKVGLKWHVCKMKKF
jgi:hypothetical protein